MLPHRRYKLTFETVTPIEYDDWPDNWLDESEAGDLLVGPDRSFGLICIDDSGSFINLTKLQIYGEASIPWPDHTGTIRSVRIVGTKIQLDSNI